MCAIPLRFRIGGAQAQTRAQRRTEVGHNPSVTIRGVAFEEQEAPVARRDTKSRAAGTAAGKNSSKAAGTRAGAKAASSRTSTVAEIPDGPPDQSGLTPRQRRVLEVIRSSVERRGYPPSMREIGEAVGLTSSSSVSHQLATLERKGFLRRDPNRPRAVDVRAPSEMVDDEAQRQARPTPAYVPLVGRIAAGGPILAEQAVEDFFPLPRELVGEGEVFMLEVKGESMIDAAICNGDWVVVRQQPTAIAGDIVAAMIDGEATVKTYKRRDGHVWLLPHNPA